MQVVVEKRDGAELSLKVEMSKEKVEEELSHAFRRLVKDTEIPGFRRGRAPRKLFEKKFGTQVIQEEAIRGIYPQIYKEIIDEHKLIPIVDPEFQLIQFSEDKPLIVKVNLITKPQTKLGRYKGIKIKPKKTDVSEDDILAVLKELQKQHARYISVKEKREAREGDGLALDWQAFHQGQELSGKSGKDDVFRLSSSALPPSLFQGLIGLKVGDHKKIGVQFPSDHPEKDFAGREITFEVTAKEIREEVLPPLKDEFARDLKFDNLESLKEHIRKSLEQAKKEQEIRRIREEIVKEVVDDAQIHIPSSLEKKKVEERMQRFEQDLKKQGYSLQDYLKKMGLKEEGFREKVKSTVNNELKTFFVLEAVAEQEGIQVSDEELEERLRRATKGQNEEKIRKLKDQLIKQGRLESIIEQMRMEKVIQFLYDKAQISNNSLVSTA